jgi:hypothetical protein
MPSVLKHTECPACGHRHHFCYLGDDLLPGQEFDFVCPERARAGRLRAVEKAEVVHAPPQGAVALTRPGEATGPGARPSGNLDSTPAGPERLQDVLPAVQKLAAKVGGIDRLSEVVNTLKDAKE